MEVDEHGGTIRDEVFEVEQHNLTPHAENWILHNTPLHQIYCLGSFF